jgi:DNA-directed RNA polymerase II subunit RPB2
MVSIMDRWAPIRAFFKGNHLERLVEHQISSYNHFIHSQLPQTIEQFNPVIIHSDQYYNKELKKYSLEIHLRFQNFQLNRPQIFENNGSTKVMFPNEARLRNFTYSSTTTIDIHIQYIVRSGPDLEDVQYFNNIIPQVHIGKIPIMLKSSVCVLTQNAHLSHETTGECKSDPGGYFIINGSEKTVIGQEHTANNRIYCFPANNSQKYILQAEMKCSIDSKRVSPKQVNMLITRNPTGEHMIHVNISRIKKNIPIVIVFRALGILSDLAIYKMVTFEDDKEIAALFRGSIMEGSSCLTQEDALAYLSANLMYMPYDKHGRKHQYTLDMLFADLFSHCKTLEQRVYLLGYMTNKLILCTLKRIPCDDRDSYLNKRVHLTGDLLNDLYRNYFNKLVRDMQKHFARETNFGSWKSSGDYLRIITPTNIYKGLKPTTIDNGIKRALSTGDFGTKHMNANKVGVAQVLNRLTYAAGLSHLRRVSKPIDKSCKLVDPRKLANSIWGFLCIAETPEGQSVGVVKNLGYMTQITLKSDASSIHKHISPHMTPYSMDRNHTRVFMNGIWLGCTETPCELLEELKYKKRTGIICIYTSIVFDYKLNEIQICTDSGRLVRPLFVVKDNQLLYTKEIQDKLHANEMTWDELIMGKTSIIEYIDPSEQNAAMIAFHPRMTEMNYTHCELHPSTIFGILASCIPFPERNQSPRNTYQCAMGKQAIGISGTNFNQRMDKTAFTLNYPHKPLVDTRLMHMLKLHELPSGTPIIVAIATYTGYNQEDSVIINQGSIDRGLFRTTAYHTEKDEDKKLHGDNEIRCCPDKTKTRKMKFANYSKLSSNGLVPENTPLTDKDIILGKVSPIKDARNDPSKIIKYEDDSIIFRSDEDCFMDKNYIGVNGEGYTFWKGRIRADRKVDIGDKFSSRHGQKGTVGTILSEADMPFTAEGIRPDLIINPHAIPSRMTIGQLLETLLGKVLLDRCMFGDGTAFSELSVETISKELRKSGYESKGNELLYDGFTGNQIEADIFIGPAFYQRLKHMVVDKHHSRARGPMVNLTRQPAEGRSRDGGLRFGEMERDCSISHGASAFTQDRLFHSSDKFQVHLCKKCGLIASYNDEFKIHLCKICENRTEFTQVHVPYAFKLMAHELITMNVVPRLITKP